MRKRCDVLVSLSIFSIKKIWHGYLGTQYKKRRKVICRFYPSCSNYAIAALEKHGVFKGWSLAFRRVKRCRSENTDTCIDYP